MRFKLLMFLLLGLSSVAHAAPASNAQVQQFVDERLRVRSEQIRDLLYLIQGDLAAIGDIYDAANQQSPTWSDNRQDVPHQMTNSDILAINTFLVDLEADISGNLQLPIVLKSCVRSIK